MKNPQKIYTQDKLIVVQKNVFVSLEEVIQNPFLLINKLKKMNGEEDIRKKDEELWKYLIDNEKYFQQNYLSGEKMALAFISGGLFTYSLLEMANEPEPLKRLQKETIHEFNHNVSLYSNPSEYMKLKESVIRSENPLLWEATQGNGTFFKTNLEYAVYKTGALNIYELLKLAARKEEN